MNIADLVQTRYTTKAFDTQRQLSAKQIEDIATLLRMSPSSTNAQPWHFFLASTPEGKAQVAKGMGGIYAFNEPKIRQASLVVVLCARSVISDAYLDTVLAQEDKDGRFASVEARAGQQRGRAMFVNMHRYERRDAQHWTEKQVYLALGTLLLGAAAMGIDACPIEGFDQAALDAELGLREQGLVSSAIVALGFRSETDFNAKLPKSRLPKEAVITAL